MASFELLARVPHRYETLCIAAFFGWPGLLSMFCVVSIEVFFCISLRLANPIP
jgi:hypothetical protein